VDAQDEASKLTSDAVPKGSRQNKRRTTVKRKTLTVKDLQPERQPSKQGAKKEPEAIEAPESDSSPHKSDEESPVQRPASKETVGKQTGPVVEKEQAVEEAKADALPFMVEPPPPVMEEELVEEPGPHANIFSRTSARQASDLDDPLAMLESLAGKQAVASSAEDKRRSSATRLLMNSHEKWEKDGPSAAPGLTHDFTAEDLHLTARSPQGDDAFSDEATPVLPVEEPLFTKRERTPTMLPRIAGETTAQVTPHILRNMTPRLESAASTVAITEGGRRALAVLGTPSVLADLYDEFEAELESTVRPPRRGDRAEVHALLHTLRGQNATQRANVSLEAVCLARVVTNSERKKPYEDAPWGGLSGGAYQTNHVQASKTYWENYWQKFGGDNAASNTRVRGLPLLSSPRRSNKPEAEAQRRASRHLETSRGYDKYGPSANSLQIEAKSRGAVALDESALESAQWTHLRRSSQECHANRRSLPGRKGPVPGRMSILSVLR